MALINLAQVADAEKVSREAVRKNVDKWEAAGLIAVVQRGRQRLVELSDYRACHAANGDPSRALAQANQATGEMDFSAPGERAAPSPDQQSFSRAKLEQAQLATLRERMRFAREAGQLTDAAEADAAAETFFRDVRDRVRRVIARNAETSLAQPSPRAHAAFLHAEMDKMFDEMAGQLARGLGAVEGADEAEEG